MTALESRKAVQAILGVKQDGDIGPKTVAAFHRLSAADPNSAWPTAPTSSQGAIHHVKASSFADPADVAAFRRCKAQGKTDQECFRVGDNGIGKWGDSTTADRPMCALPPEDWVQRAGDPRGALVLVTANGKSVICELRDTMPHKANIKNGAGIDLNPAACRALGLEPPIMVPATWAWV